MSRKSLPGKLGLDLVNIFDKDWDLLIILDACRVDALQEVSKEYDFICGVDSIMSLGSSSEEWMENTFINKYRTQIESTAYITGNPHSEFAIEAKPGKLDHVWKYSWDEDLGTIRPDALTDKTIEVGRTGEFDRHIVHYMQPHFPTLNENDLDAGMNPDSTGGARQSTVWEKLRDGQIDRSVAWQAYVDNLREVLNSVRLLINNFDAEKAIITADHGNAFGEFGMYGHDGYISLPVVREVPWCLVEANDHGTYEPSVRKEETSEEIESRLEDLGYLS